ncbi:AfsR family transcriptional regulator, partial [Streptomyces sp. SID5785]|nr:AfsR family transcriptional regulator [Streptomyces sp. SID5785]
LRTALRHAIADRDEQEALSLVLSLAWFWQMRDLRAESRIWTKEATELGPDPFAGPTRPAPPLLQRCTDVPPPIGGELLEEARRQAHLCRFAYMDMEMTWWQSPEGQDRLRAITGTYRADLPQACRTPGNIWYFAVVMTGDMERLHELTDISVATCRELGYDWELALILQLRANLLANRSSWAATGITDADEAIELFTRLGDAWGVAEGLSARGEAHEKLGRFAEAGADYRRARELAEDMGAHSQSTILQVRLAQVLIEQGDTEVGERMLWEALEAGRGTANEARPIARMILASRLAGSDRTAEARAQLDLLREEFEGHEVSFFHSMTIGMEAMIDVTERCAQSALAKAVEAAALARDPLAAVIMPHLAGLQLITAARALVLRGRAGDAAVAARLIGAADAALPEGHIHSTMERTWWGEAKAEARAALGDAAYEREYAEGGGLSVGEATALL